MFFLIILENTKRLNLRGVVIVILKHFKTVSA